MKIELGCHDIEKIKKFDAVRPFLVKFQLTNACNARCDQCNLYKTEPIVLPEDIVINTMEEARLLECEQIDLTGGEPTLHPGFLRVFEKARALGLEVKVNTNGYNVDETLAKEMVKMGLKELAISIDYHSPEIHNKHRGLTDGWQRAISAIQYVDRYRQVFSKDTKITLYSIINNQNYRDASKILDLKRIANYDEINFIPIKNNENKLLFLDSEQLKDFYDNVRPVLLEKYLKFGFGGIYRTVFDPFEILTNNNSSTLTGDYTKDVYGRISCHVPSFYSYIISDGSVVPCCVAPHHLSPQYIMGNLHNQGFKTIWESNTFDSFRKSLLRPSYNICSACSGHHTAFNLDIDKRING